MTPKYVPGQGPTVSPLMVIAEAPGKSEEEAGIPLIGSTGQMVNEMLVKAGTNRSEVYCTNVVKIRPPDNKIERLGELGFKIEDFLPQLRDEIRAINPNCILALGNVALKALCDRTNILNWRGSILTLKDGTGKVVPTVHPAALLHMKGSEGVFKFNAKFYIQLDFNRAVEESKFRDLRLPGRLIEVCKSSIQLHKFLSAYRNYDSVSIDIETIQSVPVCIGLAFSKSHAMSIPLFNAYDWEENGLTELEYANIWKILFDFLDSGIKIIGQNFKFDHEKLLKPCGFKIHPGQVLADTMWMAHVAHAEFPKKLQWLTSVYTREPYYKDEGKEFNPKKDKIERLFHYNGKDCAVTKEIYEQLLIVLHDIEEKIKWPNWTQEFFFDYVMKLHDIYLEMESNGFVYNFARSNELWNKYSDLESRAMSELISIAGSDVNPNSPKQVGKLLFDKLGYPYRGDTSEDTLVALLANHAKSDNQKKAIELILDLRRYRKTKSTYLAAMPDYDGRLRTNYRVTGTETGRTSTSVLKAPVRPHQIGLAFQTMTKHGDIGAEIRELMLPDEGYELIECDLSQAEARIVAHLAGDEETLKLFDTTDIHKLTASICFGIKIEDVTPEQRFVGKTVRHAGNYGMGKRRLMQELMTSAKKFHINIYISEWKAGQILDKFHGLAPKIRGVYHQEIERIIRSQRFLVNPFGRYRMFYDRMSDDLIKEALANLPQSTVRDQVGKAMIRIKERLPNLQFLMESHDALVVQEKSDRKMETAKIIKEEMEKEIDFARCSIPRGILKIPAEVMIGKNYRELLKVKV